MTEAPGESSHVPVPDSWEDETKSAGGVPIDPWQSGKDPWSDGAVPSKELYQQFCAWWRQDQGVVGRESSRGAAAGTSTGDSLKSDTPQATYHGGKGAAQDGKGSKKNASRGPKEAALGGEKEVPVRQARAKVPQGRKAQGSYGGARGGPHAPRRGDDPPEDEEPPEPSDRGSGKQSSQKSSYRPPPGHPGGPPEDPYDDDDPEDSWMGNDEDDEESSVRTSEVRSLLMKKWRQHERPKSSLGSVRIEDFYGERGRYRGWRRVVRAQQQLYRLEPTELSMLIYLSCKKEARDVLDQLTIEEMVAPGGLARVWQLLDEAYHETSEEYFERVEAEFNAYRRQPGQSVASYLSQIKRLKADYLREDPGTVYSDRAWAQRLLVRASLSKRERLDCFFSAGGTYNSREIERALRHRCQRIHEEERKIPGGFRKMSHPRSIPSSRSFPSSRSSTAASTTTASSKGRGKGRSHGSHVAAVVEDELEAEMCDEDEDFEMDADAYEVYLEQQGEPEEGAEDVEGEGHDQEWSEEDAVSPEELREAFAAGWRAKDKISERRKGRNFRMDAKKDEDPRKKTTTCSSCGGLGHWRGDPQCPKVKSGEDPPFKPKPKQRANVHVVSNHSVDQQRSTGGMKVHEVSFAFVVGGSGDKTPAKPKLRECSHCQEVVRSTDKFCPDCGVSLAVVRMTDVPKRRATAATEQVVDLIEDEGWERVQDDDKKGKIPVPTKALAAAAGRRCKEEPGLKEVTIPEAVAAVSYMSKSEKKQLMRELQENDERMCRTCGRLGHEERLCPLRDGRGYSPPRPPLERARASTEVAPGRSQTTLRPPTTDLPEAVKKRQLEEFRRALYDERCHKGRLSPSEGAPLPTDAQRDCPHPWSRLRWSANQHGHFARCRGCDLKNVLCWHERHGSYMVQDYLPKSGVLAIADSGCKTSVGGSDWHQRFQRALKQRSLSWMTLEESEVFKFGAGEPITSRRAHIYPIGLHGHNSYLRMSEVGEDASDCPGLIGPAELARWHVNFKFGEKVMEAMGEARPMTLTPTRHPGLDLLDFGDMKTFDEPELQHLVNSLKKDPFAFAFVAQEDDVASEVGSEASDDYAEDWSQESEIEEDGELWQLVQDMEQVEVPLRDKKIEGMPGEDTEDEVASDVSTTSHEFGVAWTEEEESSEDEDAVEQPAHDVMWAKMGERSSLTKGKKRRLRSHMKEVREAFHAKPVMPRSPGHPKPSRPERPYKVLEVFTWTLAITMTAVGRGWQGLEPVTLPRWDLRSVEDRKMAFEYLLKSEPDLLVLAWPCTVWSPLQYLGGLTPEKHKRLLERQQEDRETFLSFVHEAVCFQRRRGRAHLGENPWRSKAWTEPQIQLAYEGEAFARVDMCRYGLKRPDTKEKLMKPTCVAGTRAVVESCAARCVCSHPHAHTLGSYKDKKGKHHSVAEFAGGYTRSFAKEVVLSAEKFLDSWTEGEAQVFAADQEEAGLPEERLMEADDEVPDLERDLEEAIDDAVEDGGEPVGVRRRAEGISPEAAADGSHRAPWRTRPGTADAAAEGDEKDFEEKFPTGSKEETSIHDAVVKMHQRLGHPSKDSLVRMLKLGGAPKEVLDYAKEYECPVCQAMAPPDRPFQQKARPRPAGFNVEVHVDLKYAKNIKDQSFVALSMLCAGTNKHAAVLLKTRKPSYVARKFVKHWVAPFGRPSRVVMDQGGEFEKEWILMLEQYGIFSTTTGSHAGWQHALAERHGGLLGITWHGLIVEHSAISHTEMSLTLAAAVEAKNEIVTRRGYSPNMLVFGRHITYPEMLGEEEFDPVTMAQNLDVDCEMTRRCRLRNDARKILMRDDVQQKLKRALQRRPATQDRTYVPGEAIYFFVPHPIKPRYRRDQGRWRGPAVVIMQESHQRYFCSWRGRCLLLAAANMRPASAEESLAREFVNVEMETLEQKLGGEEDSKVVEDMSTMKSPLKEIEAESKKRSLEARRMMAGLKSVRKLIKQSKMLQDKRTLRLRDAAPKRRAQKRLKAIKDGSIGRRVEEEEKDESVSRAPRVEIDDEEWWNQLHREEDEYARLDEQRVRVGRDGQNRRSEVLEDFPEGALRENKREGTGEDRTDLSKRMKTDFYTTVMLAVSDYDLPRKLLKDPMTQRKANEWLSRSEVKKLRDLLDLPVTSARLHRDPRKRFQKPPGGRDRRRVTVLLGEKPGVALLVQEDAEEVLQRGRRRAPFEWRGLTLFVKDEKSEMKKEDEKVLIQHGEVLYQASFPSDMKDVWWKFVRDEERSRRACEIFLLRMKASGKELDPKYFDEDEWKKFRMSDEAEWFSWIQNEVVEPVPKEKADKIPRNLVFRIPLRWVRTNKNKELDCAAQILAKSRLVIPGHADPHLGQFRTDAPTTNPVAVRLLKTLAVSKKWNIQVFDVTTAFLSGNPTSREVYVRAPCDGLPQTKKSPALPPYTLLKVLKSAYGLAEAPRLWYLRAAQLLQECGMVELPYARATFVATKNGSTQSVCTLHVDDGMLAGDPKSKEFQALLSKIDANFNIKEWKTVAEDPVDFLGCKVFKKGESLVDCMKGYVLKIQPMKVEKGERPLNQAQTTSFRRLVMQLRWPAQHVLPEKLYCVSELAQEVTRATMKHAALANRLLMEFKVLAEKGMMQIVYRPVVGKPLVVSFFDASLGKSTSTKAQRGQVHFITTEKVNQTPVPANLVEFKSSRITRVVKSSLAAEGNALSAASDEQLYLRLLCESLWCSPMEVQSSWKEMLKIPGVVVTDAKALYDHLLKTGHMTAERQTMLDILAAKQLVESSVMAVAWVPTFRQYADGLTKDMPDELFRKFKTSGLLCLRETPEDAKLEQHRAALRRAQRERRKFRMTQKKA